MSDEACTGDDPRCYCPLEGVVDHALLGHPEDIFVPVEDVDPDVILLGHDQHHDEDAIRAALEERGSTARSTARPPGSHATTASCSRPGHRREGAGRTGVDGSERASGSGPTVPP